MGRHPRHGPDRRNPTWTTSLFPKEGGYLVPLKDRVRAAEGIEQGDGVELVLTV